MPNLLDPRVRNMLHGLKSMCGVAVRGLLKKDLITDNNKANVQEELFKFAMAILKTVSEDFIELKKTEGEKITIMINNRVLTFDSGISGGYITIKKKKDEK